MVSEDGEGEELTLVSETWGDFEQPVVSPDGSQVCCTRWTGAGSQLLQISASTIPSSAFSLCDDSDIRVYPQYSPADGTIVVEFEAIGGQGGGGQGRNLDPSSAFALRRSEPNPFSTRTAIRYQIPVRSDVVLSVFDVSGRMVRSLVRGPENPGVHAVTWDGLDDSGQQVADGVYFYQLDTPGFRDVKKAVVMR